MNVTQNSVYNCKAVAYVQLNISSASSYASFNTFYKSTSLAVLIHNNHHLTPTTTDTFQTGTLIAEYGMIGFFSNIFANTAASGMDVVDLTSAVLINYDNNIYVGYSGVSAAANDLGTLLTIQSINIETHDNHY